MVEALVFKRIYTSDYECRAFYFFDSKLFCKNFCKGSFARTEFSRKADYCIPVAVFVCKLVCQICYILTILICQEFLVIHTDILTFSAKLTTIEKISILLRFL